MSQAKDRLLPESSMMLGQLNGDNSHVSLREQIIVFNYQKKLDELAKDF